jgi:hypothetical protein
LKGLDSASKEVDSGQTITFEDFKKEMQNWKNRIYNRP